MTVIYLHELGLVPRPASEDGGPTATAEAISGALRYLIEDAQSIGEGYMAHIMDLAALEGRPFREAEHRPPAGEVLDDSQVLVGIRNCLRSLETEAGQAGEEVMSNIIAWARSSADRKAGDR